MRLRVKGKDYTCPLCKQEAEFGIVYSASSTCGELKQYFSFGFDSNNTNMPGIRNDEISRLLFVDCDDHYNDLVNIRSFLCPHSNCIVDGKQISRFRNEKELVTHINKIHKLTMCLLCLDKTSLFVSELKLMNEFQLKKHNKSSGHPICQFCNIHVYVMRKIEGKYKPLFESKDFYDLVEGSKIFLHLNNYQFYEEQLKFAYGNKMNDTIRLFFLLKFLKMFLYKKYSLLVGEFIMLGGSFFLFSR
jgi:hypothetical protein